MGLSLEFVTAADETWRLQRGTDPECRFFQSFADRGHHRTPGATRQGIYAVTPSGRLLGSLNSLDPRQVAGMLRDALELWETLDEADRKMPPESELMPTHRWEDSYPEGGLVLRMYSRDLPPGGEATAEPSLRWNRDHVWFSREEMRLWLPDDAAEGGAYPAPQLLVDRLTRFHLVDNVKGQTIPFREGQVRDSELTVTVAAAGESSITLRIEGETLGHAPRSRARREGRGRRGGASRPAHGVRLRLSGTAVFDRDADTFTKFDLTALGVRWGRTENNGRRRQIEPTPIGIAFELAPNSPAARVAPAFAGPEYASWIELPEGVERRR